MKRLFLIATCLLTIFTSMFLIAEHFGFTDEEYAREQIEAVRQSPYGLAAVGGMVIGLLAIDLLLPVPSSVVMQISGSVFGVFAGAMVSLTGSMIAAALGFYICRIGGHKAFERLIGKEDTTAIDKWFDEYGVYAIILSRPVPMMTEVLSCLAGLTDMKPRLFFNANLLGHLPVCLVYAYFGSISSLKNPWPAVYAALLIPAIGWLAVRYIKRRNVKVNA